MCVFCQDLRNIEPAKYIGTDDEEFKEMLKKADAKKKFIMHWNDEDNTYFAVIEGCPKCGHKFTEEDYDSYF